MYRMAPTYHQLRRLHFRITIKAWLRGIDKALLAFAGVLPIGILAVLAAFVLVQAEALRTLLRAEAPLEQRLAVIVSWQFVTFLLLRALREAVLMPKSRAFFSSLPCPAHPNYSPISRSHCRDTRSSGRRSVGWHLPRRHSRRGCRSAC